MTNPSRSSFSALAGSGQTSMLIKVGQRRFRCQSVPLSKQCQPISVRERSKLCQDQRERSAGWFVPSRSVGTPARHGVNRDGSRAAVVVAADVAPLAAYSCGAPASLAAPPSGTLRLAIPSAGAINASRSSTGANRSRCFITSARIAFCASCFVSLDAAATTLAIADPGNVRVAAPLLGHRTFTTTERYYQQAKAFEAHRQYIAALFGWEGGGR